MSALGNRPAYPVRFDHPVTGEFEHYGGMTLRQRYAMAAMQGLLSNPSIADQCRDSIREWLAEQSFKQADAMLAYEENEAEVEAFKQGTKAVKGGEG